MTNVTITLSLQQVRNLTIVKTFMNYTKLISIICTLILLMTALILTGVLVASGTAYAEDKGLNQQDQQGNMFSSTKGVVTGTKENVGKRDTSAASDFADRNDKAVASAKAKPKTKKIIIGVILISIVVFIFINLIAASDNARFCTNCHYSGRMKIISISKKHYLDSLIILLANVFPIFLYYYSERARFLCPRCNRTSTNVSIGRQRHSRK